MKDKTYKTLQLLLAVVFIAAQTLPVIAAGAGHGHSTRLSHFEKYPASNAGVKRCVTWEESTADKEGDGLNGTSQNCEGVANCSYCNSALFYAHNFSVSQESKQYVTSDVFPIKQISSKLYRPPKTSLT